LARTECLESHGTRTQRHNSRLQQQHEESKGVIGIQTWSWKRSIDAALVEIGGIDKLGGQLDASYGLLLNLLPNLPADAERRPLK
jgi:hypothetical protein